MILFLVSWRFFVLLVDLSTPSWMKDALPYSYRFVVLATVGVIVCLFAMFYLFNLVTLLFSLFTDIYDLIKMVRHHFRFSDVTPTTSCSSMMDATTDDDATEDDDATMEEDFVYGEAVAKFDDTLTTLPSSALQPKPLPSILNTTKSKKNTARRVSVGLSIYYNYFSQHINQEVAEFMADMSNHYRLTLYKCEQEMDGVQ